MLHSFLLSFEGFFSEKCQWKKVTLYSDIEILNQEVTEGISFGFALKIIQFDHMLIFFSD